MKVYLQQKLETILKGSDYQKLEGNRIRCYIASEEDERQLWECMMGLPTSWVKRHIRPRYEGKKRSYLWYPKGDA